MDDSPRVDPPPGGASPVPSPGRGLFWPVFIVAMLGGHALIMSSVVYVATRDPSFAVEPDYYRKALDWDADAAQRQVNARLGWGLAWEIGEEAGPQGERWLTCLLRDREGQPIPGARASVEAFPHKRGNERVVLALDDLGEGRYAVRATLRRTGAWTFRATVQHAGETFTWEEEREVGPARPQSGGRPAPGSPASPQDGMKHLSEAKQ